MKFCYADPPYLNQGKKLYGYPMWDDLETHRAMIERMCQCYPDGWALSASSPSLRLILPLCPPDVRVASWVKPFHAYKKGVRPAYAWEPVIYRGGRNTNHPPPAKGGKATTPKDWIACNITLKKGLTGAKPEPVCEWIISLLNPLPADEFRDIFPGTGVFGRVWDRVRKAP